MHMGNPAATAGPATGRHHEGDRDGVGESEGMGVVEGGTSERIDAGWRRSRERSRGRVCTHTRRWACAAEGFPKKVRGGRSRDATEENEHGESITFTHFVRPYKVTLAILLRRGACHGARQIYLYKAGKQIPQVTREVKCEIQQHAGVTGRNPMEAAGKPEVGAKVTPRKDYGKESSLTISLYTNTSSPEGSVGWWRSARSFHPTAHQSELISL